LECINAFSRCKNFFITCEFVADHWNLLDIRDGMYDNSLLEFSASVKSEMAKYPDSKFYLRPLHEFNGHWYNWETLYGRYKPGIGWNGDFDDVPYQAFKDAWIHIVDFFRNDGAPVLFQLSYNMNNGYDLNEFPLVNWFPGDNYVDQVLITGYNRAFTDQHHTVWLTFDDIYKDRYTEVANMTNKKIGIGEISTVPMRFEEMQGNSSSEYKVEWLEDAFTKIKYEYPLLKSVTWFLENKKDNFKDNFLYWGLNSDAERRVFRDGVSLLRRSV
jgi:beta-mannanase